MADAKPSRASQTLAKKLEEIGQAEAQRRTGISQGWLSKLARGLGEPNIPQGLTLQQELGIVLEWWEEPPEAEKPVDSRAS